MSQVLLATFATRAVDQLCMVNPKYLNKQAMKQDIQVQLAALCKEFFTEQKQNAGPDIDDDAISEFITGSVQRQTIQTIIWGLGAEAEDAVDCRFHDHDLKLLDLLTECLEYVRDDALNHSRRTKHNSTD